MVSVRQADRLCAHQHNAIATFSGVEIRKRIKRHGNKENEEGAEMRRGTDRGEKRSSLQLFKCYLVFLLRESSLTNRIQSYEADATVSCSMACSVSFLSFMSRAQSYRLFYFGFSVYRHIYNNDLISLSSGVFDRLSLLRTL